MSSSRTRPDPETGEELGGRGKWGGLQGRAERLRARLLDIISREMTDRYNYGDFKIIGYGAPAKATTLLNFCKIDNNMLAYVIDTTPAKQDRYIPGTGIKIIADDDDKAALFGNVALLLAWNYLDPIVRNNHELLSSGGSWIIPIPSPMMI